MARQRKDLAANRLTDDVVATIRITRATWTLYDSRWGGVL